jgi:hypothetical protein
VIQEIFGERPQCPVMLHFGESDQSIPLDKAGQVAQGLPLPGKGSATGVCAASLFHITGVLVNCGWLSPTTSPRSFRSQAMLVPSPGSVPRCGADSAGTTS